MQKQELWFKMATNLANAKRLRVSGSAPMLHNSAPIASLFAVTVQKCLK